RKKAPPSGWHSFYMPIEDEPFLDHDRAVATCKEAIRREREYLDSLAGALKPNMPEKELDRFMEEDQGSIKLARTVIEIWTAMLEVLDTRDLSGRLFLSTVKGGRTVRVNKVLPLDKKWRGLPTLLLDATLPDASILRTWFPNIKTMSIDADMPFTHVRQ